MTQSRRATGMPTLGGGRWPSTAGRTVRSEGYQPSGYQDRAAHGVVPLSKAGGGTRTAPANTENQSAEDVAPNPMTPQFM